MAIVCVKLYFLQSISSPTNDPETKIWLFSSLCRSLLFHLFRATDKTLISIKNSLVQRREWCSERDNHFTMKAKNICYACVCWRYICMLNVWSQFIKCNVSVMQCGRRKRCETERRRKGKMEKTKRTSGVLRVKGITNLLEHRISYKNVIKYCGALVSVSMNSSEGFIHLAMSDEGIEHKTAQCNAQSEFISRVVNDTRRSSALTIFFFSRGNGFRISVVHWPLTLPIPNK